MKFTVALHRRLAWAQAPAALLVALLQRTPLLRVASTAEDCVIASPMSGVLRSAMAGAASLGALHTLVGASGTIDAAPPSLVTAAGQASTGAAFNVPDADNISSWQLLTGSQIPPGMKLSDGAGDTPAITGPGIVNVGSGDFNQVAVLTGTPTTPGTYDLFLVAWSGQNGTGDFSTPEFVYQVVVTAGTGVAPAFALAASPSTASVATGRTVVFNAIATGTPAPTYQWKLNGSTTIPGTSVTNDPILVITGATSADAGTLACTATNSDGSATSSATLTVTTTTNPGYLTNLSGRGVVGSGPANALFGGFGTSGTGTKNLLIRGMGPSLTMVGIPAGTELVSTQLTLYNNVSVEITQNTDWGGNPTISTVEAEVGAYPVPANSLDSMLYVSEPVSAYSASVGGVNGDTGIAVIELYDADNPPLASRLVNLSVRAPVGTGNNILFGGFSIGGSTDDALLIRAIGPSLASQLSGFLAQPVLTIFVGSNPTPIYSNTVWGGDPALAAAENVVGAYPISTSSKDSLLLISLPPGNYSAEITGVNFTTGIAVVEIYEVH